MKTEALIDEYVASINAREREQLPVEEVPEALREAASKFDGYTSWRILRKDQAASIHALTDKIKRRFPPSFEYFITHYSFPAFDSGPITFFANTGLGSSLDLEKKLFGDPHMSPALLKAGFLQIGNPAGGNYDPVCFDANKSRSEHPIVQLNHEAVIQHGEIKLVEEIAPSFIDFLKAQLKRSGA